MWEVPDSARKVAERSRLVRIVDEALLRFCDRLSTDPIPIPSWDKSCHYFDGSEKSLSYILVLDTLNFCFWAAPGRPRWEIPSGARDSHSLSGYVGLAVALKRAVESGVPVTAPGYLAEMTTQQLRSLLGGTGELQLMETRSQILNELGRVLLERFQGRAAALVESAAGSALKLVRLLVDHFASFRDTALYLGEPVCFYKRAQIFAADLCGAFEGRGWGRFEDIDRLTAFADYKLPQVLRHLGIFHYEPDLADKVDRHVELAAGSREEVEIRANTIWAVERIRWNLAERGKSLKAFEIDWVLWNLGQEPEYRLKPYHRTVTIYY